MKTDRPTDVELLRLAEDDCWRFLADRHLGRVALVHMGQPMIYPVNYALDGRSVVFRSAPGSKLTAAGIDARVAFEVDEVSDTFESGTSIVVHGELREETDPEERERLRGLDIRPWAPGARDHFLRVDARWISGRRIMPGSIEDGLGVDAG